MIKTKGLRFWFMLFAIQIFVACAVPTAVLLMVPPLDSPVPLSFGGQTFLAETVEQAEEILNQHYRDLMEKGMIILEEDDRVRRIPFTEIEMQINVKDMNVLAGARYENRFYQMIGKTNPDKRNDIPGIWFNEARLHDILSSHALIFETQPKNAMLTLKQNTISVISHINGYTLSIDKAVEYIREKLRQDPTQDIVLSKTTCPQVFEPVVPVYTVNSLDEFVLYSMVEGIFPDGSIEAIEKMQNRNILLSPGEVFSFRESFSFPTEFDQTPLVSAIYQVVLPLEDVKVTWRRAAPKPVDGITAGFEVNLDGDGDLKFVNSSNQTIAIVINVDETGKWVVAQAGKPGLTVGQIKTEATVLLPQTIYTRDNTLKGKEQRIVDAGRDGLSVRVFRSVQDQSIELYEDIYLPVNKIIAVGSEVTKEEIIHK